MPMVLEHPYQIRAITDLHVPNGGYEPSLCGARIWRVGSLDRRNEYKTLTREN
jgi:hypothetical protein